MLMFRPLIRYADFKGRASRGEFWLFGILQSVFYCLLIGLAVVSLTRINEGGNGSGAMIALGVIGVCVLALLIPNYAVLVRRLHDSNRGAVWLCLLIPSILTQLTTFSMLQTLASAGGTGGDLGPALISSVVSAGLMSVVAMICQLILFVLMVLPGTRGDNRFGPDPHDPTQQHGSGNGGSTYDDARLEELFAQARRENGMTEQPYKPVFDFGPGPTSAPPVPAARSAVDWGPAASNGISPAPTFGRRGV